MADGPPRSTIEARPLSRGATMDVLRYWLDLLRLEEALTTRPRARRQVERPTGVRVDAPTAGQDYFKLPFDEEVRSLVAHRTPLVRDLEGERGAFFETWLAGQYRRGDDDGGVSHLLAFPVLLLPRGELAGLLRRRVALRFGYRGGGSFAAPSYGDRMRGRYPPPPDEIRLAADADDDAGWPFFVDGRLLHHQLGVPEERIDGFFAELHATEAMTEALMLERLCGLLEAELTEAGEAVVVVAPSNALERLTSAVAQLLALRGSRVQAYPVGIVVDATRAKTTWHLQRDLQLLLEPNQRPAWEAGSPLDAYLTGRRAPAGMAVQRALFEGPALTPRQRATAEQFWGSRLSAVQGPPGTGKTTVILHLCAEALVRQVENLLDERRDIPSLLLVTSTNNRAVDQVADSLATASDGLPLALRAGSRQVCETTLRAQLEQTRRFLRAAEREPLAGRKAALAEGLAAFAAARAVVDRALEPRVQAYARATERAAWEAELAELEAKLDDPSMAPRAGGSGLPTALDDRRARALLEQVRELTMALDGLARLCDAPAELRALAVVRRRAQRLAKERVLPLRAGVVELGLPCELTFPPLQSSFPADPHEAVDAWVDAIADAQGQLGALDVAIRRIADQEQLRGRWRRLRDKLDALPTAALPPDFETDPSREDEQRSLFLAAREARRAWAAAHARELVTVIERALRAIDDERSLRPLFRDDPKSWNRLGQLFGVWTCTLLSLGNCFPPEGGSLGRVIIDEAGQCHPAYAVSALWRSQAALVIGDVHQLEPVLELRPEDEDRLLRRGSSTLRSPALAPYRVGRDPVASVQSLADRAVARPGQLIDHFRCAPEIIAISDALCGYGLTVHPRPAAQLPGLDDLLPDAVSSIDVEGEQTRLGGSWWNPSELEITVALVEALLARGLPPQAMAVITPYRGQLEQLRRRFTHRGIPLAPSAELGETNAAGPCSSAGAALGTVHRFQGGERSIVVFSTVVTRQSSLAFLDDRPNLLNVAVSRAQHRFVAVGHRAVLAAGQRTALLLRSARSVDPAAFRASGGTASATAPR